MELEAWCEKFLKDIFENSESARELAAKAIEEDWDDEKLQKEMLVLIREQDFKTYEHYKVKMADFIMECAEELKK